MEVTIDDPFWQTYVEMVNRILPVKPQTDSASQKPQVDIYARVSLEEQKKGYSIEMQVHDCKAFAERNNLEVANIFIDEGFTGTNSDRPGFQRAMANVRSGVSNGLIVHKIDRAHRNAQGMLNTFSELQHHKVFFVSVMEQIDFTTIWGKLILVILAMLAEIFVDNLREEAKKGKKGRALIKNLHNGPIPWGYCAGKCSTCKDLNGPGYCYRVGLPNLSQDGRMVPHPIDSQGFKYATSLYLLGTYTHKKVADALNEFKVETPDGRLVQIRSRGKLGKKEPCPFTKDMVREMLKNPIYTGVIPYYSSYYDGKRVIKYLKPQDIFPGVHLALITKSEFKQMEEIRNLKSKAPQGGGKKRRPARVYLLQGLLDCHRCGAPMHCQAGSKNNRRHHCRTHLQRTGGCDQPSVMADRLEADLINQLAQVNLPVSWQEEIIGYLIDEEGLAMILAQRQALKEHIEMIRDMHHQKEISRQVYLQEWQEFERNMARLSLEKSTTIDFSKARLLLADFPLLWSKLTALEQKQVTQSFLNRATVEDGRIIAWDWNAPFADLINGPQ